MAGNQINENLSQAIAPPAQESAETGRIENSLFVACDDYWAVCTELLCDHDKCADRRELLPELIQTLNSGSDAHGELMRSRRCKRLLQRLCQHSSYCVVSWCRVPFCRFFTEHPTLQRWSKRPPRHEGMLSAMVDDFYRAFRDRQIALYEPDSAFVQLRDDMPFDSQFKLPLCGVHYNTLAYTMRNGSYATTVLARGLPLGPLFIVKKIVKSSNEMCNETVRMLKALRAIAHPSIVTHYFAVTASNFLHVGMEFVEGECLEDLLRGGSLPKIIQYRILCQVVSNCWKPLHAHGITYFAFCAKNLMVLANSSWDVKLTHVAQYAMCSDAELSDENISDLTVPLAEIAAPEMLDAENSRIDPNGTSQWSIGYLFNEMLTESRPHPVSTTHNFARAREDFFHLSSIMDTWHARVWQPMYDLRELPEDGVLPTLIRQCWQVDPQNRPSLDDIFQHLRAAYLEEEEHQMVMP